MMRSAARHVLERWGEIKGTSVLGGYSSGGAIPPSSARELPPEQYPYLTKQELQD
jgi:hypothetical protein